MKVDYENFILASPSLEGKLIESRIMMRTRELLLQRTMRNMGKFLPIKMNKIEAKIREELDSEYRLLEAVNERYSETAENAMSNTDIEALQREIEKNLHYARSYKRNMSMIY